MDNSVQINLADFLEMLKTLKRFARKKQAGDAVLSMEGQINIPHQIRSKGFSKRPSQPLTPKSPPHTPIHPH